MGCTCYFLLKSRLTTSVIPTLRAIHSSLDVYHDGQPAGLCSPAGAELLAMVQHHQHHVPCTGSPQSHQQQRTTLYQQPRQPHCRHPHPRAPAVTRARYTPKPGPVCQVGRENKDEASSLGGDRRCDNACAFKSPPGPAESGLWGPGASSHRGQPVNKGMHLPGNMAYQGSSYYTPPVKAACPS
eukprot:8197163-Pyramimonas_sp.AAC.2